MATTVTGHNTFTEMKPALLVERAFARMYKAAAAVRCT